MSIHTSSSRFPSLISSACKSARLVGPMSRTRTKHLFRTVISPSHLLTSHLAPFAAP